MEIEIPKNENIVGASIKMFQILAPLFQEFAGR